MLSVLGVIVTLCVCVCVNGASPVMFVLSLFYLCAFQMNPVYVVCGVTSFLRFVSCSLVCDRGHKSK